MRVVTVNELKIFSVLFADASGSIKTGYYWALSTDHAKADFLQTFPDYKLIAIKQSEGTDHA
jgi:hypothetical protein